MEYYQGIKDINNNDDSATQIDLSNLNLTLFQKQHITITKVQQYHYMTK